MDTLMIVVALILAYVLFVSVAYLLIRLMFPKIEVNDNEEVKPVRNRYAPLRDLKKQKNLAY